MGKVVAKFAQIVDNAESVTASLADIMGRINSGHCSLGMLLKNDTLAKEEKNESKILQIKLN